MHSAMQYLSIDENTFTEQCCFQFGQRDYRVVSNSPIVIAGLKQYFAPYLRSQGDRDICIYLQHQKSPELGLDWHDWPREAGKTGLKEQVLDAEDGRWVRKFKTGMVFFQHLTAPLAVGPCEQHQSQIINFILNQHINYLQQQGGLICHAACLQLADTGIAIAAFSGGGKSTSLLKLMEGEDSRFVSNDRLFLFDQDNGIVAKGIPKQPRVNPGTLLFNPRLRNILKGQRQRELKQLPTSALWQLEEKYDVMVNQYYGDGRSADQTRLDHVLLLNWKPGREEPVAVTPVDLAKNTDLIAAIAKSPGPFYQDIKGHPLPSADIPDPQRYLDKLAKVSVWEVTGGANFEQLRRWVEQQWQ